MNRPSTHRAALIGVVVLLCADLARADNLSAGLIVEDALNRTDTAPELTDSLLATDVSLVVAAPDPTGAASMLGHVYLAFGNRDSRTGEPDPLGVSFEFAAATGDATGFDVVWTGLVGGFPTLLRRYPNWQIANRYRIREKRDLWVFPLRLDHEERERLRRALTNAALAVREYRFISNNCATELARVVGATLESRTDAARTEDNAIVSPARLVSDVVGGNAVSDAPILLPSSVRTFDEALRGLTAHDRDAVLQALVGFGREDEVDFEASSGTCRALDAGLRIREQGGDPEERLSASRLARKVAARCGKEGVPQPDQSASVASGEPIDPSRAHGPARISVGVSWPLDAGRQGSAVLSARLGLHELGEPRISDRDYMGATFLNSSVAVDPNGRARVLSASLFSLERFSFAPGTSFGTTSRFTTGFEGRGDFDGANAIPTDTVALGGSLGIAFRSDSGRNETVGYALGSGAIGIRVTDARAAVQFAPVLGTLVRISDVLTLRAEAAGVPGSRLGTLASLSTRLASNVRITRRFGLQIGARLQDEDVTLITSVLVWFP